MKSYLEKLEDIKAFVFDVDGVFTDGTVTLLPSGDQIRKMNIKDGYAVQHAVKRGVNICIISGGKSEAVRTRFQGLGVQNINLGASYKMDVFDEFLLTYDLTKEDCLYMGDDMPDLEIMSQVGLAVCPNDAAPEIKEVSHYISPKNGGEGAVRDILEQYLKAKVLWSGDKTSLTW